MRKYVILTETGADLTTAYIQAHQIYVLPFHIAFGDVDHLDCDITNEDICKFYEETGKVPVTAAVNPDQYQRAYDEIRKTHPGAVIIHIGYTSRASCAYQNAVIADDNKGDIYHIDSLNASAGFGFVVMKAVQIINEHPDIEPEELVARVQDYVPRTKFCFIPGNLDFLRAGGRVSNMQYLGANLFKIKPLIEIREGKLFVEKKYRGKTKSIAENMIKDLFTKYKIELSELCLVASSVVDREIRSFMEDCVKKLGVKKIIWLETGCTITCHAGPGGIGIAAMEEHS